MDLKQVIEELKERGYKYTTTKSGLAQHLLTASQRVDYLADRLSLESDNKMRESREVDRLNVQLREKQETIDALLMCIRDLHQKDKNTYRFDIRHAVNHAGCNDECSVAKPSSDENEKK